MDVSPMDEKIIRAFNSKHSYTLLSSEDFIRTYSFLKCSNSSSLLVTVEHFIHVHQTSYTDIFANYLNDRHIYYISSLPSNYGLHMKDTIFSSYFDEELIILRYITQIKNIKSYILKNDELIPYDGVIDSSVRDRLESFVLLNNL